MNYFVFKPIFDKYNYKKKGNFFCKALNDKDVVVYFYFDKICSGRVLTIDIGLVPMIYPSKWIEKGNAGLFLLEYNNGYLLQWLKNEYDIKDVSEEEYKKNIAAIIRALDEKVLPFLEEIPVDDEGFCDEYLSSVIRYYASLFEIKYHKNYAEAKKILETWESRVLGFNEREIKWLEKKERELFKCLQENNLQAIDKILETNKKIFLSKNKRYI